MTLLLLTAGALFLAACVYIVRDDQRWLQQQAERRRASR